MLFDGRILMFVFVLLLMLVTQSAQSAKTPPTSAAASPSAATSTALPPITYRCNKNNNSLTYDITSAFGNSQPYSGWKFAIAQDNISPDVLKTGKNPPSCAVSFTDNLRDQTGIISGCNLTQETMLYLMKSNDQTTDTIIGGRYFRAYQLPCDFTDKHELGVKQKFDNIATVPVKGVEVPNDLDMVINNPGKTVNHIGDTLTVTISKQNPQTYDFHITSCVATPFPNADSISLKLISTASDNTVNVETDVVPLKPPVSQQGKISFTLYAFRFYTSSTVEVACKVLVCKTSCTKRRKRRSTDENLHSTRATFTVVDNVAIKSGQTKIGPWSTSVIIVFAWMALYTTF